MNDESIAYSVDKRWSRRSFDRASATYDTAAVLQTEVRNVLLQRLDLTDLSPVVVVDAGAGTGHAAHALKRRYPNAHVLAVDSSLGMLNAARRQRSWFRPFARVCADVERLPLADGSVDLIVSNFMLQWSNLDAALGELRRVLAARGFLSFATLGPDTLRELRAAWARAGSPHPDYHTRVSRFLDMHDIGDAMVRVGFAAPVLDVERYTLTYTEVRHLAQDLKAVGARNATIGRPKGLTGPRRFAAMQSAYEAFRIDGRLPATYEVIFGQAWGPAAAASRADETADLSISLDELKRQLRKRRRE
ncbi:MAG TPA: malonyl-ACP O-methyltransferase BioC [Steroidobacteraceae bacterium]|nr:malonyl-ACP O-methyltransferase BioC [Steroidobacteraceae bacterium]